MERGGGGERKRWREERFERGREVEGSVEKYWDRGRHGWGKDRWIGGV